MGIFLSKNDPQCHPLRLLERKRVTWLFGKIRESVSSSSDVLLFNKPFFVCGEPIIGSEQLFKRRTLEKRKSMMTRRGTPPYPCLSPRSL